MRFALLLACVVGIVASVSCNGDDGGACSDYEPPPSFDAQNPQVSFSRDVVPIFNQSCAFTVCHGSTVGNSNGVFLGGGDPTTIHKNIVDVRSSTLNTMSFVKPGDPRQSFLMRKVDGSHCVLNAQCVGGTCGDRMPDESDALPVEDRDKIRRWIAQGAKND